MKRLECFSFVAVGWWLLSGHGQAGLLLYSGVPSLSLPGPRQTTEP